MEQENYVEDNINFEDNAGVNISEQNSLRQTLDAPELSGKPGVLYLCATPIGNLEDITLRVLRVLREADIIAAEDTRHTRQLLTHFAIHQRMTSYHQHNQKSKAPELLSLLREGKNIALVTDAGLPGISDPGSDLVQQALAAGLPVEVLPGASAGISALTVSGLSTERFVFEAFLPRSNKEYKLRLQELARETRTIVFYEAPHRLVRTLEQLTEVFGGERRAVVARELTKKFEEIRRDTLTNLLAYYTARPPRGEITVLIAGMSAAEALAAAQAEAEAQTADYTAVALTAAEEVALLTAAGAEKKQAMKQVAQKRGLARRDVYNQVLQAEGKMVND